jgi:hypothetical protein
LGSYYIGFGFHAFRREAITAISASAGVGQAMNPAGHCKSDMSQEHTLIDLSAQEHAVRLFRISKILRSRHNTRAIPQVRRLLFPGSRRTDVCMHGYTFRSE